MSQQRFDQQSTVQVRLAQHFLTLLKDPGLNLEDVRRTALLRKVLHHLAHVGHAKAIIVLGQLVTQDQLGLVEKPIEQQQQRHGCPGVGQLAGRLLLLEQLLHTVGHQGTLFMHAVLMKTQGQQRRAGRQGGRLCDSRAGRGIRHRADWQLFGRGRPAIERNGTVARALRHRLLATGGLGT